MRTMDASEHESSGSMDRGSDGWSAKRVRQAGSTTMLGGALAIVLAPLVTAAYHLTPEGATESVAPWEPALRDLAGGLLTFASPTVVYNVYGALAFLAFAGLLTGVVGLRVHRRSASGSTDRVGRAERWGFRAAIAGLALNLVGNVGDYWIGSPEMLDFLAFLVGTVVGLLVLAVGFALVGIAALQTGFLPPLVAWSLVLWLPAAVALSALGLNNIPGGALVPLGVVGVVLGRYLRSEPRGADTEVSRTDDTKT